MVFSWMIIMIVRNLFKTIETKIVDEKKKKNEKKLNDFNSFFFKL